MGFIWALFILLGIGGILMLLAIIQGIIGIIKDVSEENKYFDEQIHYVIEHDL